MGKGRPAPTRSLPKDINDGVGEVLHTHTNEKGEISKKSGYPANVELLVYVRLKAEEDPTIREEVSAIRTEMGELKKMISEFLERGKR